MFTETIQTIFSQIKDVILNYDIFADTLDILFVAFIVYGLIMQLRKTQSIQVIKGIILIVIAFAIVSVIGMETSSYMFSKLFRDIIVIFVVLFSAELRQALENVGKRRFSGKFSLFSSNSDEELVDSINAVCRACGAMSRSRVGSLIVFQRNTLLGNITKQAVPINAVTTYEMICSIFYPKAPLHDGAVVIKDGKIVAARCVIPMKNDREITENVGTRHRAALEVSFNSDAVVVVTSEETGMISLAVDGQLKRGMSDSELRELLGHYLLADNTKQTKKSLFSKKKDKEQATVQNAEEAAENGGQQDTTDVNTSESEGNINE
ncbi:MAG: diadenylate cyclase CdaA [Clostridia bacterium]|nr:diadenylate cyclase CdaA [Clostridia bacterium]